MARICESHCLGLYCSVLPLCILISQWNGFILRVFIVFKSDGNLSEFGKDVKKPSILGIVKVSNRKKFLRYPIIIDEKIVNYVYIKLTYFSIALLPGRKFIILYNVRAIKTLVRTIR